MTTLPRILARIFGRPAVARSEVFVPSKTKTCGNNFGPCDPKPTVTIHGSGGAWITIGPSGVVASSRDAAPEVTRC